MPYLHNRLEYNPRRRRLRHAMTDAEIILWSRLKGRGLLGYKFRRQHGIGKFVVDFYCPELKMVIELDGSQHYEEKNMAYDRKREAWMNKYGIITIRYPNADVRTNLSGVLEDLSHHMGRRAVLLRPPPSA